MKRILLLVIFLILYGSFYPWRFHYFSLPYPPWWILLHSWPGILTRWDVRDAVVNVVLYMPLGMFCFMSMKPGTPLLLRGFVTLAAGMALSATVEMLQIFDFGRNCSIVDLICNTAGTGCGIVLAAAFPTAISSAVSGAEAAGVFGGSGATALLYLWAGSLLFPFMPVTGRYLLRLKLEMLRAPGAIGFQEFFEGFATWLAAAALFDKLAGWKRALVLLPIALLLIPLKLFISGRSMTFAEAAGAMLGIAAWAVLRKSLRVPAALLMLAALVAAGLYPFRLSTHSQPFTWVPFVPLLETPWVNAFQILMQKTFLYGSAVWLLHLSGPRVLRHWMLSALLAAAPLAVVEVLQIYLPGRTPEITDPLLALFMGAALMLLERHSRRGMMQV